MAEIFKGVSEALGRELRVPKELAQALEAQETLALLQVRVVERSANSRFTEGSAHGGERAGGTPRGGRASPAAAAAAAAAAPRLVDAAGGK